MRADTDGNSSDTGPEGSEHKCQSRSSLRYDTGDRHTFPATHLGMTGSSLRRLSSWLSMLTPAHIALYHTHSHHSLSDTSMLQQKHRHTTLREPSDELGTELGEELYFPMTHTDLVAHTREAVARS
jgi:hypothetical protein